MQPLLLGWAMVAGVLGFVWSLVAVAFLLPLDAGIIFPQLAMTGAAVAAIVAVSAILFVIRNFLPNLEITIWRLTSSVLWAHLFSFSALAILMRSGNAGVDWSKASLTLLGLSAIVGLLVGIALNFGLFRRSRNVDHVVSV